MKKYMIHKGFIGPLLLLLGLTYCYLYPGSYYMFSGRTDVVLSDDTDPAPLPYSYQGILNTFQKHPSYLFYGAVALEGQALEGATPGWFSWVERWLVVFWSNFLPLEQIGTGVIFSVVFASAALMYLLGFYIGWSRSLSLAIAIAWAFTPYTRARAKVHGMLAGTFHVPAIFLGLYLLAKGKTWRSTTVAAALFLLASMSAHYYIVTAAFLSPLFVIFFYLHPQVRENYKKASIRLVSALLPAVVFLTFNLAMPVPSGVELASPAIPKSGETRSGENHPFLTYFAAHPIDYLSGDLAAGTKDLNPIRGWISQNVLSQLDNSNPHERSNGIRWIFLILAATAVYYLIAQKDLYSEKRIYLIYFFTAFAILSFWLSLSPDSPLNGLGLSGLQYKLISQIRVPSRAGILVNFSVLMLAGYFITAICRRNQNSKITKKNKAKKAKLENFSSRTHVPKFLRWLCVPAVLPVIAVVELPPFLQNPTTSHIRPIYSSISESPNCQVGMHFPFTSPSFALGPHYHFIQRMRKSSCKILNQTFNESTLQHLLRRFAYHRNLFQVLNNQPDALANSLASFARCLPMTWIVFDRQIPESFQKKVCNKLNWTLHSDASCISDDLTTPMQRNPKEC